MRAIVSHAGLIFCAQCFSALLHTCGDHGVSPIETEDGWQVAAPESVGIDGGKLCALVAKFEEWTEANLHGVVVVRHGKLAFEHYFRGYDLKARNGPGIVDFTAATPHDLRSMTKSVTALVTGAVIDRGIIASVDQPVLSFFPEYADLCTPQKERITLRHLLTMSMGTEWSEGPPWTNEITLSRSRDPYRYVLSLPIVEPPGAVWNYSAGATALIGGVLARATGKRLDHLAATLLFDPLGISDVAWTWLPNGDPVDWCCFWMRPHDMAKIGQLVLDRGRWKGEQVISEDWINAATGPQITTSYGEPYGYQLWLFTASVGGRRIGLIAARGQGGQCIYIVPTLDLVTVVTAGNYYDNDRLASLVPKIVLDQYVLPAVAVVP